MNDIKNKLNKPLIIITYIIVVWLGVLSNTTEKFHMNSELNDGIIWAKAIKGAQNFGFFWKGKEIIKPNREAAEAALNEIKKEI